MNVGWIRHGKLSLKLLLIMGIVLLFGCNCSAKSQHKRVNDDYDSLPGVTMNVTDTEVVIDNGIVQITIANPEGHLMGVCYGGVNNILETPNKESNRGYWDIVWGTTNYYGTDWLLGSTFNVIVENEDQVEVSFSYKWDSTTWNTSNVWRIPANVDRRYIMLRGSSGFYTYMILEREEGVMPEANIFQIRTVYKLDQERFQYMAISDDRQRIMPSPKDRETGLPLAFKEAVLLTDPTNPNLRGEVDDKYQYSCDDKDNKVHGWISFDPQIGFWIITPSNEFRSAGPVKQDLTSHVGPTALAISRQHGRSCLPLKK